MLGLLLLCGLAMGQEDLRVGHIALEPTPGYRVEAFPRTHPLRVELGVYDNRVDLDDQLEIRTARWLTEADAISVGGGIWFVSLYLERPDIEVRWHRDETDRLVVEFVPGAPEISPLLPEPEVASLVEGLVPRRPKIAAERALHPLDGDALSLVLRPQDLPLEVPTWSPPAVAPPWDSLVAPLPASWAAVDVHRRALADQSPDGARSAAYYRLARAHSDLDLHREALYYIDRLDRTGEAPAAVVALERARAQMLLGRWDQARDSCAEASHSGATAREALLCLAGVSLYTMEPPPTETARALLAHEPTNRGKLLAAELLLRDRRTEEAAIILEEAVKRMEGRTRALAWANLGDARYYAGDPEGAFDAWMRAYNHDNPGEPLITVDDLSDIRHPLPTSPEIIHGVLALRLLTLEMSQQGLESWAQHIPELERVAAREGRAGAEAHYLLAQVALAYDDQELAALHLGALMDEHLHLASRSNAPDRLLAICAGHLEELVEQGHHAEAVAFYRDYWRTSLEDLMVDPQPLQGVALALEELGLVEQAVDVQRSISAVHLRYGIDQPEALLILARLYARSGRLEEARDAIAYTRQLPASRHLGSELDLLEGHALRALDDRPAALAAYTRASRDPRLQPEAAAHMALLRADSDLCAQAVSPLRAAWERDPPLEGILRAEVGLSLARCRLELDQPSAALEMATAVAQSADGPDMRARARYLAAVAASLSQEPVPDSLGPVNPVWQALIEEEEAQATFMDRLPR